MTRNTKQIEWIVALAIAYITTLPVLGGVISVSFPSLTPIYHAGKLLVAFLLFVYQRNKYGLKIHNKFFFFFYIVYLIYILLYLTVLRVFPIERLESAPQSIVGFIFNYFPLFCCLLSVQTIMERFDIKKYCLVSFLLCTIPSIWYISFVGVSLIQLYGLDNNDDLLSFLTIGYANVPILAIGIFYYDKLLKIKWANIALSAVIISLTLFVLLISTRRGPIIWGAVVIWCCYLYKKKSSFKAVLVSAILLIIFYFSLSVIIEKISTIAPETAARLEMTTEGYSNGRFENVGSEGVYITGWEQVVDSPFFGSYFRILSSSSRYQAGYPHNVFIEMLMTMGLVGFIPFMILLIQAFLNIIKLSKSTYNSKFLFCAILFLSIFFMLQTSGTIVVQADFWLFLYLLLSSSKLCQGEKYKRIAYLSKQPL